MSKMGRAVLWVQENGLKDDPAALSKYINQKDKDGTSNKRSKIEHRKNCKNISRR